MVVEISKKAAKLLTKVQLHSKIVRQPQDMSNQKRYFKLKHDLFSHPHQVVFVPLPDQRISSRALSLNKIKKLDLKKPEAAI